MRLKKERDDLVFRIQSNVFKSTTLGIRMCSTELLLRKNQKGSTRYPITLVDSGSVYCSVFKHCRNSSILRPIQAY